MALLDRLNVLNYRFLVINEERSTSTASVGPRRQHTVVDISGRRRSDTSWNQKPAPDVGEIDFIRAALNSLLDDSIARSGKG
jgi:hypothetical protein